MSRKHQTVSDEGKTLALLLMFWLVILILGVSL